MNKKAYGKYITSLLLFGMNGIVASRIALSSDAIVASRTLIGSLFLIIVCVAARRKLHMPENKTHRLYAVISGAALGVGWIFLYEAYRRVGVSVATLAYYCGPVIVMILSPVLFREKLTGTKIAGFFAVLMGMVCVNLRVVSEGKNAWGLFCGIMAAMLYAVMVIFNKKAESVGGLENSLCQLVVSFGVSAVFLVLRHGFTLSVGAGSLLPILLLGVVNTGIGCTLYFSSFGELPVQTVAVCGYLEPLSAVVFSALFLHERMDAVQVAGAVLILGGAAFGETFHRKKPDYRMIPVKN